MSDSIIKVENLAKSYVINHEGQEQYTALRDVMANRAKKIFSFGLGPKRTKPSKEEFWALNDVSFDIRQGDRVGIIGRNGAGKSTLLKVLSRITEPTRGRITIKGRVASLLEVGTGFHPELTGRENIFLNGAILGMSRSEIKTKFDEIVAFAEIEKFLDTPVKRYSSGMYVRLAFAVAAHLEPEILIIDEVLAVGDAQFQRKCLGKMEDVSKNEGRTVLFVSHNMGVIAQLCNNAILLKKGQVLAHGSTSSIIDTYISDANSTENGYQVDLKNLGSKSNYFNAIWLTNDQNETINDFSFKDRIFLNFTFTLQNPVSNLQIGIGLNDKYQNRIFTVLKPIDFFIERNGQYKGRVSLPPNLIAPNSYSFAFAIWTKDGHVFDLIDNICPIKIYDSGTELSLYEGIDYGSVIVNPTWENAEKIS
jgi:lipopolysaccharide transport system ATP-binding protein